MLSLPEEEGKCPVIVLGHSLLAFCEFLRYPNHLASNVTVAQSRGFESFQKAKDNLKAFQVGLGIGFGSKICIQDMAWDDSLELAGKLSIS